MNNAIKYLLVFLSGAAIGSGVTYAVIKSKLEKQAEDDEWNKERTERLKFDVMNPPEPPEETEADSKTAERVRKLHEKPDISKIAAERVEYHDYTKHYKTQTTVEPEAESNPEDYEKLDFPDDDEDELDNVTPITRENRWPFLIDEEDFGANENYERVTLTYCADDILVDENDEVVDPVEFIGEEAIGEITKPEVNETWVCNPRYGCYYNVVKSLDPYFHEE